MTDHPILFKPEMVRALLEGRKIQTRRVFKLPHNNPLGVWEPTTTGGKGVFLRNGSPAPDFAALWHTRTGDCITTPFQAGDRLWVKETWHPHSLGESDWNVEIAYAADNERVIIHDGEFGENDWNWPKAAERGNVSPLFMPRWASRLTLIVTDVRVQRLQDITGRDAVAEGIQQPKMHCYGPGCDPSCRTLGCFGQREEFARLWDSINAKPRSVKGADGRVSRYISYPWGGEPRTETYRGKPHHIHPNPWVAAYTFDVTKGNIDRIGGAA